MSPSNSWDRFRSEPRRPPPPGGRAAPATSRRGSKGFASTWWGEAWIEALEQRARLDVNRLPRGRTYARQGYVLDIALEAGLITARVAGSRSTPYAVTIRVRTFGDAEWEAVADVIASRAAHAAALLDGDLEPGVVDDARDAGVELLPDAGDLQPRCSCPDWADPCKHAAAVCYLVASELDADPFRLFALRGRGRDELLASVRARRMGSPLAAEGPAAELNVEVDPGVVAREAFAAPRMGRHEWPAVPTTMPRPGTPAPWPVDPPASAPFDAVALRALATDAIGRTWALRRGEGTSGLDLSFDDDLARRAAAAVGGDGWPVLVQRSSATATELSRLAFAWQHGGSDGVAVQAEEPWSPGWKVLAEATDALVANGAPAHGVRTTQNRVTVSRWRAQLRMAHDGRWWGFRKLHNRWELATAGFDDVDDAAEALADIV